MWKKEWINLDTYVIFYEFLKLHEQSEIILEINGNNVEKWKIINMHSARIEPRHVQLQARSSKKIN